jgi:hypothetical protein
MPYTSEKTLNEMSAFERVKAQIDNFQQELEDTYWVNTSDGDWVDLDDPDLDMLENHDWVPRGQLDDVEDEVEELKDEIVILTIENNKVSELKKEIEKLKKEVQEWKDVGLGPLYPSEKNKKENEELKKENEELKKEIEAWKDVCDDYDTPDLVKVMIDDMKDYYVEKEKESKDIEMLKEDNARLQRPHTIKQHTIIKQHQMIVGLLTKEITSQKNEIEELKKEIEGLKKENESNKLKMLICSSDLTLEEEEKILEEDEPEPEPEPDTVAGIEKLTLNLLRKLRGAKEDPENLRTCVRCEKVYWNELSPVIEPRCDVCVKEEGGVPGLF